MSDCLFCKIVEKKIPATVVHEDPERMAFWDINPQAPTHVLIIPRKHIETLNDLADGEDSLVGKLVLLAKDLARREKIEESGYRLVFNCNRGAGQSVFHIHLHLLGGRPMHWPPG